MAVAGFHAMRHFKLVRKLGYAVVAVDLVGQHRHSAATALDP